MRTLALRLIFTLSLFGLAFGNASAETTRVLMKTSLGDITLELDGDKAPLTVKNFLDYAEEGFYNGTVFHRVIKGFMIQGGGFGSDMQRKNTRPTIQNEADNGLKNDLGTIAMARTSAPHSASAQFFINHKNNDFLNFKSKDSRGWGYAVFGKVVEGMDIVDKIAAQPVGTSGGMQNVPSETISIESISIIK